jgi:hypothetical protein
VGICALTTEFLAEQDAHSETAVATQRSAESEYMKKDQCRPTISSRQSESPFQIAGTHQVMLTVLEFPSVAQLGASVKVRGAA